MTGTQILIPLTFYNVHEWIVMTAEKTQTLSLIWHSYGGSFLPVKKNKIKSKLEENSSSHGYVEIRRKRQQNWNYEIKKTTFKSTWPFFS